MFICIDGLYNKTRQELHENFQKQGEFPAYYGNNLDALYDCLTQLQEEVFIQLMNKKELLKNETNYLEPFIQTLLDAQKVNNNIKLQWE